MRGWTEVWAVGLVLFAVIVSGVVGSFAVSSAWPAGALVFATLFFARLKRAQSAQAQHPREATLARDDRWKWYTVGLIAAGVLIARALDRAEWWPNVIPLP